ncbi:acetylornithine transaminase [Enterococcus italicus]|uniref:Acetylornithine aminotransferase n=1 Tax=Enterococcus italicus (strain DSM 15952 / CCUG 50447 / LMG 22039 / TP 1.5) TaxID=888064 RepID=E6LHX6_ENTI1|nr:acetylornithine transaminase [Enterococcus italicus]EFU73236.1 aminotransferase, acetylornithine/succinylornithine family [Enterococcus italicus DSM 15952]
MATLFPTYNRFPFELISGEGVTVFDQEGNSYLDLTSGIGVCNLGYNVKQLNEAVTAQLGQIWHTSNLYESHLQEEVAEKLTQGTEKVVFFCNSGTEANEAALKLARKATGKTKILSFAHSFHGRSVGSLSLTGNEKIKEGFGDLLSDVTFVAYNDFHSLQAITSEYAAVIVEVIQGEGGMTAGEADWLEALDAECKEKGVLLIIDEVQTGIGRTGKLFAYQHYALDPDIVTSAKGLANGIPVGAMIGKKELAAAFSAGTHGTTFGGNPLAMAAANQVLTIIDDEFLEAVTQKADLFWYYLEKELSDIEFVEGISGKGLMIGIHLAKELPVADVIQALHQEGILTLSAHGNTLRLLPPLVIKGAELIEASQKIKQVLQTSMVHQ